MAEASNASSSFQEVNPSDTFEEVEEIVYEEVGEGEEEDGAAGGEGDDAAGDGEEEGAEEEVEVEEEVEEEEEEEGEEGEDGGKEAEGADAEGPQAAVASDAGAAGSSPAAAAAGAGRAASSGDAPAASASEEDAGDNTLGALAGSSGGAAALGTDIDLTQLEAQAAKVAKDVQEAAKSMSSTLSAGFKSALGTVPVDAGGLAKLAGGLSNWWASLDPTPAPKRDETAERVAASNKASSELQDLLGLSAEENLVEQFKCKLLQTYACSHNSYTPAIQMAFQGTMYITDRHTCFSVEERGRKLPFKVLHGEIAKATRQRPPRKGDLSDLLKLELSNGQWLAFKDFDSGSALDSALALVEHLMEG